MKNKLLAVVIALIIASMSVPAFAAGTCNETHLWLLGTGYCNANGVNVRTGPGTSYTSLGMLFHGDQLMDYQTQRDSDATSNWMHVHGKHIGWMHVNYYTLVEPARTPGGEETESNGPVIMTNADIGTPVVYERA